MAEKSVMWTTGATGDGASEYTQAEVIRWLRQTFLSDNSDEGVLKNYDNELEVTSASSPVAVNTGAAYVYGFPYWNTSSENVAIPTPSGATRIDRVVLRAGWVAQTVRITRVAGTEGLGTPPALTQSDGVTWDIPLAQASITTGGVITVTDERVFVHPNIEIEATMLGDDLDGNGLTGGSGAALAVNVDDSTIEINADALRLKDGGITTAKIADGQVTAGKITNRTRKFFVPATVGYNSTTPAVIAISTVADAYGAVLLPNAADSRAFGHFHVPEDYLSGMTAKAICRGGGSGANVRDINYAEYGASGETYSTHSDNSGLATEAFTAGSANNLLGSTTLASVAKGDIVSLRFLRDGDHAEDTYASTVGVIGWVVEYTADA